MERWTPTPRTVVFALCGSFCSFGAVLPQVEQLQQQIGRASCRERV